MKTNEDWYSRNNYYINDKVEIGNSSMYIFIYLYYWIIILIIFYLNKMKSCIFKGLWRVVPKPDSLNLFVHFHFKSLYSIRCFKVLFDQKWSHVNMQFRYLKYFRQRPVWYWKSCKRINFIRQTLLGSTLWKARTHRT